MAKIVVTYGIPSEGLRALAGHEVLIPPAGQPFPRPELERLIQDADAVLACTALDAGLIARAERLRLIVCYGAGYDAIDVSAATARGIPVANTPDCVSRPTAELAAALICALARRVVELDRLMRDRPPRELFGMGLRMGTSLEGAVLGVAGMGRIGGKVADFGRFMGMRVLYASRAPKPARDALGDERVPLETLMAESDFISLHYPLTPQTRGLISREMIARMKPTAFLINTARGAVVDEGALIDALRARRIAGAALDVYPDEPNVNPALLALDNALLTPHTGTNTLHARNGMARAAAARILDALDGRIPENVLNPEVYTR